MTKRILITLFLMAFVGLASVFLDKSEKTSASINDNVSGWGWIGANWTSTGVTNPVGWISFNDANPEISAAPNCTGVSYGVNVVGDQINGVAWIGVGENNVYTDCNIMEKTIGWIYFDSASGWPTAGKYDNAAKLIDVAGKKEIAGWAPIISSGGVLTWVRFKEDRGNKVNYKVVINADGTVGTHQLPPNEDKCVSGSTDHYAWAGDPREGGLGWIDMCKVKFTAPTPTPALSVDLEVATDSSTWLGAGPNVGGLTGYAPLNNVDFRATVSGTATGRITYKFDYTNDGRWDDTFNNITENPKIVGDVYNYSSVGTYTAKVEVNRGGRIATDTATIWVLPAVTPTPTPTVTPTPGPLPIWREIAPFLIPFLPQ